MYIPNATKAVDHQRMGRRTKIHLFKALVRAVWLYYKAVKRGRSQRLIREDEICPGLNSATKTTKTAKFCKDVRRTLTKTAKIRKGTNEGLQDH